MVVAVHGQVPNGPHNNKTTSLFANFDPWCTIFQTNTGSPMSSGILTGHALHDGGNSNEGESIVADFNFYKDATYSIDVNVSEFNLTQNFSGRVKIILANNPAKHGCAWIPFNVPTPAFPGHFVVAEHDVNASIFGAARNIHIDFKCPNDFNSIVIFPLDTDPDDHFLPDGNGGQFPAEVWLWLNCVKIQLYCYNGDNKTFPGIIPSGNDIARNFYIGSSFGQGSMATNTIAEMTDYTAAESIVFAPNTTIQPTPNDLFLARIGELCLYPYDLGEDKIVTIEDMEGCFNIASKNPGRHEHGVKSYSGSPETQNMSRGISDKVKSLMVYPNPVKSNLKITLPAKSTFLEIYNVHSQLLERVECYNQNELVLDMANFTSGVYFLRLMNEDPTVIYNHKILKE